MSRPAIHDSQGTRLVRTSKDAVTPKAAWNDQDHAALKLLEQGESAKAIHLLMEHYGDSVRRYCYRMLRDKSLADDICQQVFLEAYSSLPKFQGRSSLRTWLFGIASHRALDAIRRYRRMEARIENAEVTKHSDAPDPRPSPAESLDDMRLRRVLEEALRSLGDPVRSMVLLRFQSGLTYEEIGSLMGESAGAVHVRIARALPRLRKAIEERIKPKVLPAPDPVRPAAETTFLEGNKSATSSDMKS